MQFQIISLSTNWVSRFDNYSRSLHIKDTSLLSNIFSSSQLHHLNPLTDTLI